MTRLVIGSLIIKHICNLDDRETVDQISENMYPSNRDRQYFLGYSTFKPEVPFDASLFVEFRKRLGMDCLNEINERIAIEDNFSYPAFLDDDFEIVYKFDTESLLEYYSGIFN